MKRIDARKTKFSFERWFSCDEVLFENGLQKSVTNVGADEENGFLAAVVCTREGSGAGDALTETAYEIGADEFAAYLDRALAQGEADADEYAELLQRAKDLHSRLLPDPDATIYEDDDFTLALEGGDPYLLTDDARYDLDLDQHGRTMDIWREDGAVTVLQGAPDIRSALEAFVRGGTIRAGGREYGARTFCELVVFAAGKYREADFSAIANAFAIAETFSALAPEDGTEA